MDVTDEGFVLRERAPGVSVEEIRSKTAGKLIVHDNVPEMQL
jgi:3-oxoacid CoA-transferase subunit B